MKFTEPDISEYDIKKFIKENWDVIISYILEDIEDYGVYEKNFIKELKKYELNYIGIGLKEEFQESNEE